MLNEKLAPTPEVINAGMKAYAVYIQEHGGIPSSQRQIDYQFRAMQEAYLAMQRAERQRAECICPVCGLRHGGIITDGSF